MLPFLQFPFLPPFVCKIENFRRIELTRVRLEEKQHFQDEIERKKGEYERKLIEAQSRSSEIVTEERERMTIREREMDRQYLLLKQKMLDEHNTVVIREKNLRNEIELSSKQLELERDQLKERVTEVQTQLEKLSEFKEKYTQKMEESMSQYKIDLNKQYASLMSNVEIEKTKIQGERLVLEEKSSTLQRLIENAGKSDREAARLREELNAALIKVDEVTRTRDSLAAQTNELQLQVLTQKGSTTLEFEITSLKRFHSVSNSAKLTEIQLDN